MTINKQLNYEKHVIFLEIFFHHKDNKLTALFSNKSSKNRRF